MSDGALTGFRRSHAENDELPIVHNWPGHRRPILNQNQFSVQHCPSATWQHNRGKTDSSLSECALDVLMWETFGQPVKQKKPCMTLQNWIEVARVFSSVTLIELVRTTLHGFFRSS